MEGRRKRIPNFTEAEKTILIALIREHFNVIENKKTDSVSVVQKTEEWIKIETALNAQSKDYYRTAENLKCAWDNMKKQAKKIILDERAERLESGEIALGGEPKKKRKCSAIMEQVIAILAPFCDGFTADVYSDCDGDNADDTPSCKSERRENLADRPSEEPFNVVGNSASPVYIFEDPTPSEGEALEELSSREERDESSSNAHFMDVEWKNYMSRTQESRLAAPGRKSRRSGAKRGRPLLLQSGSDNFFNAKIEALDLEKTLSMEDSDRANALFVIQLAIEEEKLKQEKMRTKIIEFELKMKDIEFHKLIQSGTGG